MKHIDDLPVGAFFDLIDNLGFATITEKIDGCHAFVGCDREGVYLSRPLKGNLVKYRRDADFPEDFWTLPFRSALKAIQQIDLPLFFECQVEILYSGLPNLIEYDRKNRIVFFGVEPPGGEFVVEVVSLETDGEAVWCEKIEDVWVMERLDEHRPVLTVDLSEVLQFLNWPSGIRDWTNSDILEGVKKPPMVTKTKWEKIKEDCRQLRVQLQDEFRKHASGVKDQLRVQLQEQIRPQFGSSEVEGYVLVFDGVVAKVVDRNDFTRRNRDHHRTRDNLIGRWFHGWSPRAVAGRGNLELWSRYLRFYRRNCVYLHPERVRRDLQAFYQCQEYLLGCRA